MGEAFFAGLDASAARPDAVIETPPDDPITKSIARNGRRGGPIAAGGQRGLSAARGSRPSRWSLMAMVGAASCDDHSHTDIGDEINILTRRNDALVPPATERLAGYGRKAVRADRDGDAHRGAVRPPASDHRAREDRRARVGVGAAPRGGLRRHARDPRRRRGAAHALEHRPAQAARRRARAPRWPRSRTSARSARARCCSATRARRACRRRWARPRRLGRISKSGISRAPARKACPLPDPLPRRTAGEGTGSSRVSPLPRSAGREGRREGRPCERRRCYRNDIAAKLTTLSSSMFHWS